MRIFLALILSYLIGSIPFALVIGKIFYNTDVRQYGSGNLGATNTFRVLGIKAGLIVAIGDLLKGSVACLLPQILHSSIDPIICGLLAVLGHIFPIFASFRGGKAVATSTGVFLFLTPLGILFSFIVFLVTLIITKYVSLSSIFGAITLSFYILMFEDNIMIKVLSLFVSIVIIFLHRKNIKRILEGTENKIVTRRD
ncbi:glycerol-3-phosphate 1-O-acyltransferase PlsY [Anoxybacillus kestanbolensis]|uniref:glycerol-3-phosphate 1-O-acyltransferase PlsY n=1 Tax=Anoxybacillus kestanbolensis TaxID=227476 RepID=UPI003D22248A